MNATPSPKLSLAKLGLGRPKTLKVMILGQAGVGKSALVVRFITRRFIGEYCPSLEKIYTFHTVIDNEIVYFEILDTAGQPHEEHSSLEANIRWAEAFILMYSVTDKCSFDECQRLKFLINLYNKKRRRLGHTIKDNGIDVPVVLVGNKNDQIQDRMISLEEGQKRSKDIGCICFHEISVRESIEQVWDVFSDTCRFWKVLNKNPIKLKRSSSDKETDTSWPESSSTSRFLSSYVSPPNSLVVTSACHSCRPSLFGRHSAEMELEEEDESERSEPITNGTATLSPLDPAKVQFRERASTDGHLQHRTWRWRYKQSSAQNSQETQYFRTGRRMSISMRGSNASY